MKKLIAAALIAGTAVMAWAFQPPKLVTTTIGYTPGSGNELSFRGVAAIIEKNNPDIKFVVQNKPGLSEIVALNEFTKSPSKGDQIFIASHQGVFTGNEVWYPNEQKYNAMDLKFVTTIAKSPLAVVATASSKTNTPQELMARLRDTKEPITFGIGATAHRFVFEYLLDGSRANRDLVKHALYNGPGQLATDVGGGHVEFGTLPTAVALPHVKAGKLKFIALAGEQPLAQLPNVPLWKDYIPGLNVYAAWGVVLPPSATPEQVEFYRNLFVPAIRSAEAKKYFDDNVMFTASAEHSPEGFKKYIEGLRKQWIPYAKKIDPKN